MPSKLPTVNEIQAPLGVAIWRLTKSGLHEAFNFTSCYKAYYFSKKLYFLLCSRHSEMASHLHYLFFPSYLSVASTFLRCMLATVNWQFTWRKNMNTTVLRHSSPNFNMVLYYDILCLVSLSQRQYLLIDSINKEQICAWHFCSLFLSSTWY